MASVCQGKPTGLFLAPRSFAIGITELNVPAFCLSIHALYRCAHSGACCTAGWPIAAETALVDAVRHNLVPVGGIRRSTAFRKGSFPPVLGQTEDGACVFFEAAAGRLCAVHRAAGPGLLPVACRNFPRVSLRDARGLFVTLSHYCPTAAHLLLESAPLDIVPAPDSLTLHGEADGLDATDVLPPLLRPGMLITLDAYSAWERHAVRVFGDDELDLTARGALDLIGIATRAACAWQPGPGSLVASIDEAFAAARVTVARRRRVGGGAAARAVRRFLAAHAFASWAAYQDGGLAAVVRSLEKAYAVLEHHLARTGSRTTSPEEAFVAAVRATDFELRHTRDHVRP